MKLRTVYNDGPPECVYSGCEPAKHLADFAIFDRNENLRGLICQSGLDMLKTRILTSVFSVKEIRHG